MKIFIYVLTLVSYVSAGFSAGHGGYSYSSPQTYSAPSGGYGGYNNNFGSFGPSNLVQIYRQGTPEAARFSVPESPDFVKILLGNGSQAGAGHLKAHGNGFGGHSQYQSYSAPQGGFGGHGGHGGHGSGPSGWAY